VISVRGSANSCRSRHASRRIFVAQTHEFRLGDAGDCENPL